MKKRRLKKAKEIVGLVISKTNQIGIEVLIEQQIKKHKMFMAFS
jgi:hypothetical protein